MKGNLQCGNYWWIWQTYRANTSRYNDAESYLNLNEVWLAQSNELRVGLHLLHVPGLHQCQSVHRPLSLDGQTGHGDWSKRSNCKVIHMKCEHIKKIKYKITTMQVVLEFLKWFWGNNKSVWHFSIHFMRSLPLHDLFNWIHAVFLASVLNQK